jgi:hypothetical protein
VDCGGTGSVSGVSGAMIVLVRKYKVVLIGNQTIRRTSSLELLETVVAVTEALWN